MNCVILWLRYGFLGWSGVVKTRQSLLAMPAFQDNVLQINHLFGHAAINHDVLPGDKAAGLRKQIGGHFCDVVWCADASRRVLRSVSFRVFDLWISFNPAGTNGIDPDFWSQADSQCVGEGYQAAFGGAVGFGMGLRHERSAGGDVDNRAAFGHVWRSVFCA
jgi:hypothetical protein